MLEKLVEDLNLIYNKMDTSEELVILHKSTTEYDILLSNHFSNDYGVLLEVNVEDSVPIFELDGKFSYDEFDTVDQLKTVLKEEDAAELNKKLQSFNWGGDANFNLVLKPKPGIIGDVFKLVIGDDLETIEDALEFNQFVEVS